MTEKELKKLNRSELLEMLIAQSKKLSRVEAELEKAKAELEKREIALTTSGSIAEAALKLNFVFEDAQRAADQYIESIRLKEAETCKLLSQAKELLDRAEVKANLQSSSGGGRNERQKKQG